jgi:hypothetical protein
MLGCWSVYIVGSGFGFWGIQSGKCWGWACACASARLQVKKEIWQGVRDAAGEEHLQLRAVGERSEGWHHAAAGPRRAPRARECIQRCVSTSCWPDAFPVSTPKPRRKALSLLEQLKPLYHVRNQRPTACESNGTERCPSLHLPSRAISTHSRSCSFLILAFHSRGVAALGALLLLLTREPRYGRHQPRTRVMSIG